MTGTFNASLSRLILRERLHVCRVNATEHHVIEDTVQRERVVVRDPQHTGAVHETYPTQAEDTPDTESHGVLTSLAAALAIPLRPWLKPAIDSR